jgi:hypothetical protein
MIECNAPCLFAPKHLLRWVVGGRCLRSARTYLIDRVEAKLIRRGVRFMSYAANPSDVARQKRLRIDPCLVSAEPALLIGPNSAQQGFERA